MSVYRPVPTHTATKERELGVGRTHESSLLGGIHASQKGKCGQWSNVTSPVVVVLVIVVVVFAVASCALLFFVSRVAELPPR